MKHLIAVLAASTALAGCATRPAEIPAPPVEAPAAGTVASISVKEGQPVDEATRVRGIAAAVRGLRRP